MKTFTILCPSRGRPKRFAEMAHSAYSLAAHPETVGILLRIDSDDPMVSDYVDEARKFPTVSVVIDECRPVPKAVNEIALKAEGDILAIICDDGLLRTKGWDDKVRGVAAKYPDGLYIAFPDAGDGQVRVGHYFTGKEWVKLFGGVMPGIFEHFSADDWTEQVAKGAGRLVHMPDLLVEHMHKKYRNADGSAKGADDATYRSKRIADANGKGMSHRDADLFKRTAGERAVEVEKLRAAIRG